MSSIIRISKGIIFLLSLLLATSAGCVLLFPTVLTLVIHSKRIIRLRHNYIALISRNYYQFVALLYCYISQTKIRIAMKHKTLKSVLTTLDENALLICNHRTRIDWIYAGWFYSTILGINHNLKYILKESLRSIPLFGWAMQVLCYIFLSRKRINDIPHIEMMLLYLLNISKNISIFIFPEGTDLSSSNKLRGQKYAQDKNLQVYNYVMHPKPGGFIASMDILRRSNQPNIVLDITIAYKDYTTNIRPSESSLFMGTYPREVYLFVERFDFDEIPSDPRASDEWLRECFLKKENLLTRFYEDGYRPEEMLGRSNSNGRNGGRSTTTVQLPISPNHQSNSKKNGIIHHKDITKEEWEVVYTEQRFMNKFSVWVVSIWILLLIVLFGYSELFRWLCIAMIVVYVAVTGFSGFDLLELMLHGTMVIQEGHIK